jgi:hypothetical protein
VQVVDPEKIHNALLQRQNVPPTRRRNAGAFDVQPMRRKSGIGSAILPMGYLVSPNHKVGREKENNMDKSHLAIELIRKDLIQAFRVEVVGSQVLMKINTTLDKGWLLARLLGGALVPVVDELWEVQVAL